MPPKEANPKTIKVFFSYAHEDETLLNKLKDHLALLKRQGTISIWHDRDISAGQDWKTTISSHLNTDDLILLLISSAFIASDYCYSIEGKRALERHKAGEARVIPVLLQPYHLKNAPFNHLEFLPRDRNPVTKWLNQEDAFENIAEGVHKVVEELLAEQWYQEGQRYYKAKDYVRSVRAYDRSIKLNPNFAAVYTAKGKVLQDQEHFKDALASYEQAITRNSKDEQAWHGKGNVLRSLGQQDKSQYLEALDCYNEVIALNPGNMLAWYDKGDVLHKLGRNEEALPALEKAIQLKLDNNLVWYRKGTVLLKLGENPGAIFAFEKAIQFKPKDTWAWYHKGNVLCSLGHYEEALKSYEQVILINPKFIKAYLAKGKVLNELGKYQEVLKVYEEIIKLEAQNIEAWVGKAKALKALSDQALAKAKKLGYKEK